MTQHTLKTELTRRPTTGVVNGMVSSASMSWRYQVGLASLCSSAKVTDSMHSVLDAASLDAASHTKAKGKSNASISWASQRWGAQTSWQFKTPKMNQMDCPTGLTMRCNEIANASVNQTLNWARPINVAGEQATIESAT